MTNLVILLGNVGNEVKLTNLQNTSVVNLSLATNDYYTNSSGQKVEQTQWHQLVAYGKTAENISKFVKKGDPIAVQGKLTYHKWQDNNETQHTATKILIKTVSFLNSNKEIGEEN